MRKRVDGRRGREKERRKEKRGELVRFKDLKDMLFLNSHSSSEIDKERGVWLSPYSSLLVLWVIISHYDPLVD